MQTDYFGVNNQQEWTKLKWNSQPSRKEWWHSFVSCTRNCICTSCCTAWLDPQWIGKPKEPSFWSWKYHLKFDIQKWKEHKLRQHIPSLAWPPMSSLTPWWRIVSGWSDRRSLCLTYGRGWHWEFFCFGTPSGKVACSIRTLTTLVTRRLPVKLNSQ